MRIVLACACLLAFGCDEPKKSAPLPELTAKPTVVTPSAPPAPVMTTVSMDENAVTINGTRVPTEGADFRKRLATELAGKPKIAGETVSFIVTRNAKMHKVASAVLALSDAKANEVLIKGPKRDGSPGELLVGYGGDTPACSLVAAIGKDVAISIWPSSGGAARRFAKGMAGPDTTLGSEALGKAVAACTSAVAFLGADESTPWGLVFDLANATKETAKSGTINVKRFHLLPDPPTPGRKVASLN
jgi:hypothetical protein